MDILLIILAGLVAGFLNTVAGGGSLITMPALIFMGLPPAMANGTNRVAIMVQNIAAVTNFKRKGYFDLKNSLRLALPAIVGSILGAQFAIQMDPETFNRILSVIMLVVLFVILFQPHKRLQKRAEQQLEDHKWMSMFSFFIVGLYGGLIQAGVGFMIIAALTVLTDYTLVKINSLKVLIVLLYMSTSLLVYAFSGNVHWLYGLILAIGNASGAWIGSSFQMARGDKWVRFVLAIAVIAMSIKLSGILS